MKTARTVEESLAYNYEPEGRPFKSGRAHHRINNLASVTEIVAIDRRRSDLQNQRLSWIKLELPNSACFQSREHAARRYLE